MDNATTVFWDFGNAREAAVSKQTYFYRVHVVELYHEENDGHPGLIETVNVFATDEETAKLRADINDICRKHMLDLDEVGVICQRIGAVTSLIESEL